jgi:hypothetical protein
VGRRTTQLRNAWLQEQESRGYEGCARSGGEGPVVFASEVGADEKKDRPHSGEEVEDPVLGVDYLSKHA